MNAEELLKHMEVGPSFPGCYYLNCGFERRVTVASQEIRGISLISALLESKRITPMNPAGGLRLAVIGAGVAGITTAVRAAYSGCDVALFESRDRPLWRFESSKRLLHPRLYEWPREGYAEEDARLPLLSWTAGDGAKVTEELRRQWEFYQRLFKGRCSHGLKGRIDAIFSCGELQPVRGATATLRLGNGVTEVFQAVIFAMGFGEDRAESWVGGNHRKDAYWNTNTSRIRQKIQEISTGGRRPRVYLSGLGDSGLTDLFAILDPEFKQESILARFLKPLQKQGLLSPFEKLFEGQKEPNPALKPKEFESELRKGVQELNWENPFSSIPEVDLVLEGRSHRFSNATFPLNRLLLAFLLESNRVIEKKPPRGGIEPIERNGRKRFDIVMTRYGAERSLQRHFPAVNDAIESYRAVHFSGRIDTGEQYFRKHLDSNSHPDRILYSDLYDSIIQRQTATALSKMGLGEWFVPLYRGRLIRDLLLFDKVVLTDSQILDGLFFREWSKKSREPSTFDDLFSWTSNEWLKLCFRKKSGWDDSNWQDVLWRTLGEIGFGVDSKNQLVDRGFVFSSLGETRGKSINLQRIDKLIGRTVDPSVLDKFKTGPSPEVTVWLQSLFERKLLPDSQSISRRGRLLLDYWERLGSQNLKTHPWNSKYDYYARFGSSFEDPWRFLQELNAVGDTNAEELLLKSCVSKTRSGIDLEFQEGKRSTDAKMVNRTSAIYEYYNRAYNRNLARQHGATVLETTYVKGWDPGDSKKRFPMPSSWKQNLALSELTFEEVATLRGEVQGVKDFRKRLDRLKKSISPRVPTMKVKRVEMAINALTKESVSSLEPELVLLLLSDRFVIEPLDEYRIHDDISPATRVKFRAEARWQYPSSCSIMEFLEPLRL